MRNNSLAAAAQQRAAQRRAPASRSAGSGGGPLLDYLVRPRQQRWRDREAERLGGFEVDDELELRRLLDGKVGRSGILQDLTTEG
jgi:hypothetical protein